MYDRLVGEQELTFCVSGKLWNRSLVMMDTQTKTLWSHILGAAMEGELKGARLVTLPADMVTWSAWKEAYPETTVLNLSRRNEAYSKEFYDKRKAEQFVIGFRGRGGMRHCSLATLGESPLLNVDAGGLPLLLTFAPESTSALLFRRTLGEQVLTFSLSEDGTLRDEPTGSTWDRRRGVATAGPLEGKQLEPHVGILSYARTWRTFHPQSEEVVAP